MSNEKVYTVYKLINQQDNNFYIDVSAVDNCSKRFSQIKKYYRLYEAGDIKKPSILNDYLHYYGEHTIKAITIGTEQGSNRKQTIAINKQKYGCISTAETPLPVYIPKKKEYEDDDDPIIIIKKTPEAHLISVKKWKQKNAEKVKEMALTYQNKRYKTDEDYRKKKIEKAKQYRINQQDKLKDF